MIERQFDKKVDFLNYAYNSYDLMEKISLITSYSKGKSVLDIGCVAQNYQTALDQGDYWLHKNLKTVASELIGLDIQGEDARKLNEHGYNILEGDAEDFDLGRQFDVVVIGDLIEHLYNLGKFFACIEKHMHAESICIITTPNPFNIEQTFLAVFENNIGVNKEHTVWLDPQVMHQLISRSNLKIINFHWVHTIYKIPLTQGRHANMMNAVAELIMKIRPICRRDYGIVLKKR